jgi:intein-encoded DNA endonuclease-like protein
MAYILGFFAADGYMTVNKRGAHFWCVQITDRDLLYKIKNCIEAEHAISERIGKGNNKNLYRLQIGSFEMCDDFRKLGFTENKTRSLAVPHVPKKYFADFIRGYFDGDGNVWVGLMHKNRVKQNFAISLTFTSCSAYFLRDVKNTLKAQGLNGGSFIQGKGTYYRLSYSIRDTLKLYDFMYNDVDLKNKGLFLKRKRTVFEKYIKLRS